MPNINVQSFKDHVIIESGVEDHFQFCRISERHDEFWRKLNKLGFRNIKLIPPETVPNVDATVELTSEEIRQLQCEFKSLVKKV